MGRGGKRGTYSGRGLKGQKSRAGNRRQPIIRELIKRYPKLKGYRHGPTGAKPTVVNVEVLEGKFNEGEKITPRALLEKKIIYRIKGKMPKVKILGKGELTKAILIENCQLSKQAKEKIEKAGGKVK